MFHTGFAGEFMGKSNSTPESRSTGTLCLCWLLLVMAGITSRVVAQAGSGAPAQFNIDVTRIISPVSPTLYGLMTEEINHSYDGGLYTEMIQNRAFHANWEGTPPWDLVRRGNAIAGRSLDKSTGPSESLPHSMKLTVASASDGNEAGLSNPGFWGYGLRPDTTYSGSVYLREDEDIGPLTVRMVSNATGAVEAQAQVAVKPGPWARYEYKLTTGTISPSIANHLEFTVSHPGSVWFQLVSLMPPTFNNRPNGNRPESSNWRTANFYIVVYSRSAEECVCSMSNSNVPRSNLELRPLLRTFAIGVLVFNAIAAKA